jgi:putative protease
MEREPELLSPAGDWECLRAAVANGADAVYFGLPRFNARMRAENFTAEELPEVVSFLHNHGVKAYVALNVLIFSGELSDAVGELRMLCAAGVDAVIIQDVGLAEISRRMFPSLRVHASTQMTITSPEGVRFAAGLGVKQVVLARELSLRELEKFPKLLPLETFVHGALCVAYSGQCLTSEALGQRSANRGECAQACRMPYELIVDGVVRDLGDKRYLLSPQDLAAVREIPALLERGVVSFKIEGRLKSAEYVAAVTSVYRKALDAAMAGRPFDPDRHDWYSLEMTFSRGLFSGWVHGVNHQELVKARHGKKRGAFVATVAAAGSDHVVIGEPGVPVKPGDGVVFDTGGDTEHEQGGRIFEMDGRRLFFEHGRVDFSRIPPGTRVWKTDDPVLNHELRRTFAGRLRAREAGKTPLDLGVSGEAGGPLCLEANGIEVRSKILLDPARTRPLSTDALRAQLGKLSGTPFVLRGLENRLAGDVILPLGEVNRLRRELVYGLTERRKPDHPAVELRDLLPPPAEPPAITPRLVVLCRSDEQLAAALDSGIDEVYVDFEDIRRYRDAVAGVRERGSARIFLATPRIQKAGEEGFFKLIGNAEPDGVLIRNVGGISHFAASPLRRIGDFSLNVANPVTASVFRSLGIERLTISHDLNVAQILDLVRAAPANWFELTLYHHMPMFHMEHCVFAAFMSQGTDHTNCGRPCERHRVHLRDRVGMEHPLRADVGCRNTLFNAVAQSGAGFFVSLLDAGIRTFRIELLEESADETRRVITTHRALLNGQSSGDAVWRSLRASSQVGVTKGTYT